jgi:hypothetical protein
MRSLIICTSSCIATSFYLYIYLPTYLSTHPPTYLITTYYLPTCIHTTYLTTCLTTDAPTIYLMIYLSIYQSINTSIHSPTCLSLSVCQLFSIFTFAHLPVHLCVCMSIRSSIDPSVRPSIYMALELNAGQGLPLQGLSLLSSLSTGIITLLVDIWQNSWTTGRPVAICLPTKDKVNTITADILPCPGYNRNLPFRKTVQALDRAAPYSQMTMFCVAQSTNILGWLLEGLRDIHTIPVNMFTILCHINFKVLLPSKASSRK